MIAGLTFNPEYDLTAVGTLALALVTLAAVALAVRALKQTQQEIEVSRSQVEESHRPLVVPVADGCSVAYTSAAPLRLDASLIAAYNLTR